MALPVEILPANAAAAGCAATCNLVDTVIDPGGSIYYYQLTATTANGWTFDHFEWVCHNVSEGGQTTDTPETRTQNPFPASAPWSIDLAEFQVGDPVISTTTLQSIKAVFRSSRIFTHLLVNSSTVLTPALLVYDPTTGLLVADY